MACKEGSMGVQQGQSFWSEWNFQKKLLNDLKNPVMDPIRNEKNTY